MIRSGQFRGQKGLGTVENSKKCPLRCFAPDKKVISRTLKIRGTLVPERERERGRDREGERVRMSKSEKESLSESKKES